MNAEAVILARGGSKSIPRKNLRQVAGKSLLRRAIETCHQSQRVSKVWVSSEDPEILLAAKVYGADLIERPDHLATDETTSAAALVHAAQAIQPAKVIVLVQCTAPLLTPRTIDLTIEKLLSSEADVAVSVVPFDGLVIRNDGGLRGLGFDLHNPAHRRRQDRPLDYVVSGECWALDSDAFLKRGRVYGGKLVIQQSESPVRLDIDSFSDLAVAEALLPTVLATGLPESVAACR